MDSGGNVVMVGQLCHCHCKIQKVAYWGGKRSL